MSSNSIKYIRHLGITDNKVRVYLLFILLLLVTNACIEPYEAEIEEETKILTIEGSLLKGDAMQHVFVSTTSSLLYQEFFPLKGCEVKIVDELDNEFIYTEDLKGNYLANIADEMLVIGRAYKLHVKTPDGLVFESDFEAINKGAEIDSVYYEIEESMLSFTENEYRGLQFYVDLKAADTLSKYFRWRITETFEYTSTGPIDYKYEDPSFKRVDVYGKWALYRCYLTEKVPGIYVTNTINLTHNEKKQIPLNYVSTKGDRLKIKYSLLVEQFSLSEAAYHYWQQKKVNSENSGGLYTRQPSQPITNFYCVNDTTKRVLGFFWAASKSKNRIMVPRINSLPVISDVCEIRPFDPEIDKFGIFPKYIRIDEETGVKMTGVQHCFDCTLKGGTTKRPDFWD